MLSFTTALRKKILDNEQNIEVVRGIALQALSLAAGKGSPALTSIYLWNPDQAKFQEIVLSGSAGNETLTIKS